MRLIYGKEGDSFVVRTYDEKEAQVDLSEHWVVAHELSKEECLELGNKLIEFANSQLNGMERIKCVNCRKEFDSKTEIINDGELKGYKSQNMYCSYTCRDKMNKKINALSIKEVKEKC